MDTLLLKIINDYGLWRISHDLILFSEQLCCNINKLRLKLRIKSYEMRYS